MNNPIIRLIIVHARENNDRRASNLIRIPSRRLNTFTLQIFLRLQKFMKIDNQTIYFIIKHLNILAKIFNTELQLQYSNCTKYQCR